MSADEGGLAPRPSAIRAGYTSFLEQHPGRVLLTGHSHQAWPDVARDAMQAAFDDAAEHVDDKWSQKVFPLIESVGRRLLTRLGCNGDDQIAFGSNTHELVYRVLSALPRDARVISSRSEFHSAYRQLHRLEEDGLRVNWVVSDPREGVEERLLSAIRAGADLLILSAVFFEDAYIVNKLDELVSEATRQGMWVLIDGYHAFNTVPLRLPEAREQLFITSGGYKYAQCGEGICFLRVPIACPLRPRFTGWFADFAALEQPRSEAEVGYGDGAARFAGATFDPTAFYRADAVLDHFDRLGLDVAQLRKISQQQTARIVDAVEAAGLDLASPRDATRRGGFVAVRSAKAQEAVVSLRRAGVYVDARGSLLRMGPAPYLLDAEIDRGVAEVARQLLG